MDSDARRRIAARIRELVAGNETELGAVARRLGVDEMSVRLSIDPDSPYPTVDLIEALVREYGVDPTWLLTGGYDAGEHRKMLEANTEELPTAIDSVVNRHAPGLPVSQPPQRPERTSS